MEAPGPGVRPEAQAFVAVSIGGLWDTDALRGKLVNAQGELGKKY